MRVVKGTLVCSKSAAELHRLYTNANGSNSTRKCSTDACLKRDTAQRKGLLQYKRITFAKTCQSGTCDFTRAAGGCSHEFCSSRHGSPQGRDISSKGDGQRAHAPGVESTALNW
jgi:hypothetical protein